MSTELIRFLTFAIIGFGNATLDTVIWKLLVNFFQRRTDLIKKFHKFGFNEYSLSHSLSFVISATSSYFWNKSLTFSDSKTTDNLQIFRFFGVASFSWFITTLFLNFLTENAEISHFIKTKFTNYPIIPKHWPLIAKILTIGVSMITNFVGYKFFVFNV